MRMSRRTMLAGSAAALAAPLLTVAATEARRSAGSPAPLHLVAAQTPATVSFSVQNNTGS